jgi:hypothetical protein
MDRFMVHSMAQRTVGSPINIFVKEEEVALSFSLHGELNALVDSVQVVQKVLELVGSLWPDDEGVIHVVKPAEGVVGGAKSSALSLKSSVWKLAMTGDSGEPMATPSICS